ncbi:LysR substrate-binding domain-containing protein [Granulicella arctica]|uniref:DNA-binding transcriptional LysR family regulator n=1 Tax=Granulicella arctica TaxID=940613 RepID=A0A7Y9TFC3_9BACT|nr:LysR substrate-binding domain-containing protein [Granulicella arctica]NYF78596.1 DNA-binding transcriptional LysR family regulator [Granulicella arctica]
MDKDIELRHLRYFVAVAEELHFGRAAQRLHLAQPPLSQQIRKLEDILGFPLFLRTSRSVRLTAAGSAFLERAQRTLRNVQRDLDETRALGRGELGSLHIGFVGSAMLSILPAILRTYSESHPRVHLHLHESFTSKVIEGLENGTLDAGILRDGDPTDTVDGLDVITLSSEPFVAVLPATHPRARQKSISPASLRGDPFVYYPRTAGTRAYEKPLSIFEEHGFRPHIVQEASHWLSILRLVGAGLGVSIAPACVRHIASPEVACIPIRGAKVTSNIELACLAGESRPIVQRFAQTATLKEQSHETPRTPGAPSSRQHYRR